MVSWSRLTSTSSGKGSIIPRRAWSSHGANLAMIYAWVGEKDLAIERLAIAAQIPSGVSYGELKLYPQWDRLRGDPRFEKVVAFLAPAVVKL